MLNIGSAAGLYKHGPGLVSDDVCVVSASWLPRGDKRKARHLPGVAPAAGIRLKSEQI